VVGAERWRESAEKAADSGLGRAARGLLENARWRPILTGIFGSSPFLTESLLSNLDTALDYAQSGPEAALANALAALERESAPEAEPALVERALRLAKRRVSLVTALADLATDWPLETVTRTLSEFAGRAADIAAGLHGCGRRDRARRAGPRGQRHHPRHGQARRARAQLFETSTSSCSTIPSWSTTGRLTPAARRWCADPRPRCSCLDDAHRRRLRVPHRSAAAPRPRRDAAGVSPSRPRSTTRRLGQNWERAAMIKARPVAGDIEPASFLRELRPFVWRKHLDFAAIQDIHSIKRQINAHKGGSNEIAVNGHNIKLGRGGIREIEFFAQTQQLIWGGRDPALRSAAPATRSRRSPPAAAPHRGRWRRTDRLLLFLRRVEHRLQMVEDQQTHTLPETTRSRRARALPAATTTRSRSRDALLHLRRVEDHYAHLFEEAPSLGAGQSRLHRRRADPDTLATIAKLGYRDPERSRQLIRGWHHGRYRAMRSARARELLTELVPAISRRSPRASEPRRCVPPLRHVHLEASGRRAVLRAAARESGLLALLADIMGSAPRLAERLARRPILFDTVLSPDFYKPTPPRAALETELASAVAGADAYEDMLDAVRRWAQDRQFQVGVQFLRGVVDAAAAAPRCPTSPTR
jgi:[glutamine synthetase] adenylyltransferase / [glutamine synthetase]-adenylyl-L-tyrosine phosphorylase